MYGGDKTGISWMLLKRHEQSDHHPAMQQHLEKEEAIEVLHCTCRQPTLVLHQQTNRQFCHLPSMLQKGATSQDVLPSYNSCKTVSVIETVSNVLANLTVSVVQIRCWRFPPYHTWHF